MTHRKRVVWAAVYGGLTHLVFVLAVAVMLQALYHGLRTGMGSFHGWLALLANSLLLVQFPVVHSFLLTRRGRTLMAKVAPGELGKDLATTTFALIASVQLLAAFLLWSPSGVTIYIASGSTLWIFLAFYLASWLFLAKALTDAGLGLQTGFTGWSSVVQGKRPTYKTFPTRGLFRLCRHPVYLGFALVMWTAPEVTVDGLVLAAGWTAYCLIGPLFKERRYLEWYGADYAKYRDSKPYIVPWPNAWRRTASTK